MNREPDHRTQQRPDHRTQQRPGQRPRLRPEERARLIEEAATRLFAQRGYASTSVEDIVAAAGVTKPMLYRHFESKQELCVRLLERYRSELVNAPLAEFGSGEGSDSAHDRLERMIDAWLAWVQAHPDATRLLFTPIRGDLHLEELQRELFERQRETQSALLREFAPGLSVASAEPLGEITRAGLAAIALWWLDHPEHPRDVPCNALLMMAQGIIGRAEGED